MYLLDEKIYAQRFNSSWIWTNQSTIAAWCCQEEWWYSSRSIPYSRGLTLPTTRVNPFPLALPHWPWQKMAPLLFFDASSDLRVRGNRWIGSYNMRRLTCQIQCWFTIDIYKAHGRLAKNTKTKRFPKMGLPLRMVLIHLNGISHEPSSELGDPLFMETPKSEEIRIRPALGHHMACVCMTSLKHPERIRTCWISKSLEHKTYICAMVKTWFSPGPKLPRSGVGGVAPFNWVMQFAQGPSVSVCVSFAMCMPLSLQRFLRFVRLVGAVDDFYPVTSVWSYCPSSCFGALGVPGLELYPT